MMQNDVESDLGWALRRISTAFRTSADDAVGVIPGHGRGYLVLLAIDGGAEPSQAEIAHLLRLTRTMTTYLLDDLEQHGLVQRRASTQDRRVRHVLPTRKGRALLRTTRAALRETEERLFSPLTGEESETLRALLARVAAHTSSGGD
ncbi:MarR family winged helix-turn-helix transcriptional regulator [Amycolatopsis pithecellobii]|uniref:MarR family transcriptional regulator n=1 Tax=Amycolatopsis pithecellobii TaxID=664692 RepID=A0A6N7YZN7_9PSEU|nr:MarR family transcriptional regulator [Amycolatopsis pithecellobii]MTD52941.1 MarR family transcriptional regulator [Amycolatopsis pithecellobii]